MYTTWQYYKATHGQQVKLACCLGMRNSKTYFPEANKRIYF